MIGYTAIRHPQTLRLNRTSIIKVLLLGFFNIYLTNILEVWGLKYLTSFKTCFIYSLSPFLSALISYIMLKEVLTKRKWLGFIVGFIGFWPVIANQSQQELSAGVLGAFSFAELAVFLAVISSVIGWILLKQLVHNGSCPPVVANGYSMLFGGVLATIHSLCCEQWNPLPVSNYTVWLESALFLIIVSNIICYNLYGYLLKRFSQTFLAFAGLSTPLFTALFGWIFHSEIIGVWFFTSIAIVFIGLFLFYFEEMAMRNPHKSSETTGVSDNSSQILIPCVADTNPSVST
jgi:drug/metabolite transporter (DMT)-like permease